MRDDAPPVTPELLLHAYRMGVFPMSEGRDDPELFWVDPQMRGIIPLNAFHISRTLAKSLKRGDFQATADTAFEQVLEGCAARDETWINDKIFQLYIDLHEGGHAHSVEVWQDGALAGGVYGVAIGGAFFGESMFSNRTNGSKAALAFLVDRLKTQGFTLFDTQFITEHLRSMGALEIPRMAYHARLATAVLHDVQFGQSGPMATGQDVLQRRAQTS